MKFLVPEPECFTKYDAFCSYIFDYACLGRKVYRYRKSSKLWKSCIHQNMFENDWWGDAFAPARTDNNVSYHYSLRQPADLASV